jgi:hypothetical protein
MLRGIKNFWSQYRETKLITWAIMPIVIIAGLWGVFQLYHLSNLELSSTIHRQGTLSLIERDTIGYRERLRYKIRLQEYNDDFYINNVMVDKTQDLNLIANGMKANLCYIDDSGENNIVSLKVNSLEVLDFGLFKQHYKNMLMINLIGVSLFSVVFGVRVYKYRKQVNKSDKS